MVETPKETTARTARHLLDGLRTEDLRVLAVAALRRWRKDGSGQKAEFQMHAALGRSLVPLLAEKKGITAEANSVGERFLDCLPEPWMQPVVDFTGWLVTSGLAIPLQQSDPGNSLSGYTVRYRLTAAGMKLLDGEGDDHPVLPGFLDRVANLCSGLPEETIAHLVDAQACLEHGLGRPAVVLAGLAYEVAIDDIVDHIANKLPGKRPTKAAEKITSVRDAIPSLFGKPTNPAEAEKIGAAVAAWDFADRLRARRNDGSHPGSYPDFGDLGEVHELLISAGRHLSGLWSVRV